ncbi:AAA family ATPase [Dyadobacter psychrotolerans]|uniref:MoxR family ATPase n=1 Tax=Dyadobacter psychrotolerans TaxID=2541721 RepID=A0A4R5DDN7_9BACT|nr:MoxR family ATPase [Dyadobacter psychrotolerans]TDE11952.1 MoxR family ATPase [Dyadobacter psychrotolerans]
MEFTNRIELTSLKEAAEKIKAEIAQIVIGQQSTIEYILTALLADGHILLEGVPGVAKTLIAKVIAKTIDVDFGRIQFTPDLMPTDVLGTSLYNTKSTEFEFRQGPVFANIVLVDEVNRAPAKTQSALFEVMEERQVTVDGTTYPMSEPFLILATQNPVEHEGTYRLPEAQLDRFLFKLNIGYPSVAEEAQILKGHNERRRLSEAVNEVKSVITASQLSALRDIILHVHVEENLLEYIVKIVGATRSHPALFLGASPRASVALLNSCKALAALRGRDFIIPDDVQELAYPVLRHRIILTPEREMEGSTPDEVIRLILEKTEVPR